MKVDTAQAIEEARKKLRPSQGFISIELLVKCAELSMGFETLYAAFRELVAHASVYNVILTNLPGVTRSDPDPGDAHPVANRWKQRALTLMHCKCGPSYRTHIFSFLKDKEFSSLTMVDTRLPAKFVTKMVQNRRFFNLEQVCMSGDVFETTASAIEFLDVLQDQRALNRLTFTKSHVYDADFKLALDKRVKGMGTQRISVRVDGTNAL